MPAKPGTASAADPVAKPWGNCFSYLRPRTCYPRLPTPGRGGTVQLGGGSPSPTGSRSKTVGMNPHPHGVESSTRQVGGPTRVAVLHRWVEAHRPRGDRG